MRIDHFQPLLVTLCLLLLRAALAAEVVEPDLPLGDINVLVVTDVHSFLGGHPHEADANADYGDVLSFYERLKEWCEEKGTDLWFVMNGDFLHGTGLAMDGNATSLIPLLNHMPWDAINMGNHEAYHTETVESMRDQMIPNFGKETFVTSNVLLLSNENDNDEKEQPFGTRYRLLNGTNNTLLVFGFLYDMKNPSELLEITKVEDAVQEDWFQQALTNEQYDAILVMAHMTNEDPLIHDIILPSIRAQVGDDMPVQFVTGHTHKRADAKVDLWSYATEAGGNLDTVGFVSFPTQATAQSVLKKKFAKTLFRHQFLNASKLVLTHTLFTNADDDGEVADLRTENGTALSQLIQDTQSALGLDEVVACPPRDFFRNVSIFDDNSIWKLWRDHVVPTQIFNSEPNSAMMVSSNSWRYDIRVGTKQHKDNTLTVDDVVAIAPYMEPVVYVGKVPAWVLSRMNNSLNTYSHHALVPDYVLVADLDDEVLISQKELEYDLYTHEFNVAEIIFDLNRFNVKDLKPERTGDRDTLYWINYVEHAWPCDGLNSRIKNVHPWFENANELEDEATDGKRTSESFDEDHEDEEKEKDSSYQGYLPPATIEHYQELQPPASSPTVAPAPTKASGGAATTMSEMEQAKAIKKHRKKVRRTIFKVILCFIALGFLLIPLVCCFMSLTGRLDDDHDNEVFYDREEMVALKKEKKKGKKGRRPRPPRPSEIEIEIT